MSKPFSKLLTAVGIFFTAYVFLDFAAWIATGTGVLEMILGDKPPLLGAISHHIAGLPLWLFLEIVVLAVVILSASLAVVILSQYKKELTQ